MSSIHAGHRQRLKDRFRKEGLDGFTDIQILELLLFFCIPRRDTNPIAHGLLDRFGSLHQILNAPLHELEKVEGVGEQASTLISLVRQISRSYSVSQGGKAPVLGTTEDCGDYLKRFFLGKLDETVYLLSMDSKGMVLDCSEVARGSVNSANVSVRKIVEKALGFNAASVVLAHNHPGGYAIPSDEDVVTTRRIAMALDAVGIILADHIVVADNDYVSLADSRLYRPGECRMML